MAERIRCYDRFGILCWETDVDWAPVEYFVATQPPVPDLASWDPDHVPVSSPVSRRFLCAGRLPDGALLYLEDLPPVPQSPQ